LRTYSTCWIQNSKSQKLSESAATNHPAGCNNLKMNFPDRHAQIRSIAAAAVFAAAIVVMPGGMAQSSPLPARVRQPTPAKVVAEHMAAFSSCDWKRLMAQFPDDVEFFAPNGVTVRGRKAVGGAHLRGGRRDQRSVAGRCSLSCRTLSRSRCL